MRWRDMRTHPKHLALLCLAAAAALPASAARAQDELPPNPGPAPGLTRIVDYDGVNVSVLGGTAVWDREDADGHHLVRSVDGAAPADVPAPPQPSPWDVDLGTDTDGSLAAVTSVCQPGGTYGGAKKGSCDVARVDLDTGALTLVRLASEPGLDEVSPAIWGGTVAFGRQGKAGATVRIAGPKAKQAKAVDLVRGHQDLGSIDDLDLDADGLAVSGPDSDAGKRDDGVRYGVDLIYKPTNRPARQLAFGGFGEEHRPFFTVSLAGPRLWVGDSNQTDGATVSSLVSVSRRTGRATGASVQPNLGTVAADAQRPSAPLLVTTEQTYDQGSANQVARVDAPQLGALPKGVKTHFRVR